MSSGGKRKGAGRPAGTTIPDKKIYVAARVSPHVADWLNQQKHKSQAIETALKFYMDHIGA